MANQQAIDCLKVISHVLDGCLEILQIQVLKEALTEHEHEAIRVNLERAVAVARNAHRALTQKALQTEEAGVIREK